MKLSDLVKLRNNLQQLDFAPLQECLDKLDGQLSVNYKIDLDNNYKDSLIEIISKFDIIETTISDKSTKIQSLIDSINCEIKSITKPFMQLGYKVNGFYGSNLTHYDVERKDRVLSLSADERSQIVNVMRKYTDWHYPVLEIGPGDGDFTESLIAGDPLYLIDRHQEFLDSTLSKFNESFRRRVRPYLTGIHAGRDDFDFTVVPKGQFGFVFAWNVINFWPYEETKKSLYQIFDLLRPGGVMMFSFNDCDVWQCAEAAETGFKSYMTKDLLTEIFNEIGFELIQFTTTSTHIHYVEIRKPGILQTSKRHQTLGKIIELRMKKHT